VYIYICQYTTRAVNRSQLHTYAQGNVPSVMTNHVQNKIIPEREGTRTDDVCYVHAPTLCPQERKQCQYTFERRLEVT
jgi:hypothetical protein